MTVGEYRALLRDALPEAADAESVQVTSRTLFTPRTHREALNPLTTVVKGARGVGKSVWFDALLDSEKRSIAADAYELPALHRTDVSPGYGVLDSPAFPGPGTLAALVKERADPELIWWAVVIRAVAPGRMPGDNWQERVRWLDDHQEERDEIVTAADRQAQSDGRTTLIIFDALERLHRQRRHNDELLTGILRVALELRTRRQNLRAKVFARPDILQRSVFEFPDASKLLANEAKLSWPHMSLYALLFHLMGNVDGAGAQRFRYEVNGAAEWRDRYGVFAVPDPLRTEQDRQRKALAGFAGEFMGSDRRRGMTYTWLPNHLADGGGEVSPRSLLIAVRQATEVSAEEYPTHTAALHWEAIKQGVQKASEKRVDEVNEDIPWVARLVNPLRGSQVPMFEEAVHAAWTDAILDGVRGAATAPAAATDAPTGPKAVDRSGLVEELVEIGVMTRRADGRIDLPDVYRVAFGLGRKGGVKRSPV